MSINSFETFFSCYAVTGRSDYQTQHTAFQVLHSKIQNYVKSLMNGSVKASHQIMLEGMLKANASYLQNYNVSLLDNETFKIDSELLKKNLIKAYAVEESDSELSSEEIDGEEIIDFLDDKLREIPTKIEHKKLQPTFRGEGSQLSDMGLSSTFLGAVLTDSYLSSRDIEYAHPHDADDFLRCANYLKNHYFPKISFKSQLSKEEKAKVAMTSDEWRGIMMHFDELMGAIEKVSYKELTELLKKCMNDGKKPELTEWELDKYQSILEAIDRNKSGLGTLIIDSIPLSITNAIILNLHKKNYRITFLYGFKGTINRTGFRVICSRFNDEPTLISRTDYKLYNEKSITYKYQELPKKRKMND